MTALLAHEAVFWFELRENWNRQFYGEPVPELLPVDVLFHWNEAFVPPCCMNEEWCGGFVGEWTPRVGLMGGMEMRDGVEQEKQ